MNPRANEWHPWNGSSGLDRITRQRIRMELRKVLGDADGKAEYRRRRGLPELNQRRFIDNLVKEFKPHEVITAVAETFRVQP